MSTTTMLAAIESSITDYGTAGLTVIVATLVLGAGMLVYKFGWRKTKGALR